MCQCRCEHLCQSDPIWTGRRSGIYPRDLPRDLELLDAEGVDLVWMPSDESHVSTGFPNLGHGGRSHKVLEGALRPGHFRGVTTVVAKLFNAVQPQKAYFGQKDAQQAVVIRQDGE